MIQKLIGIATCLISIMWQPSTLGQNYGEIVFALACACILAKVYLKHKFETRILVIFLAYPIYQAMSHLIGANTHPIVDVSKNLLTLVAGITLFSLCSGKVADIRPQLKAFVYLMTLVSFIGLLTIIIRWNAYTNQQFDFSFPVDGYHHNQQILLPFACFYSQIYWIDLLQISLPRFLGTFREPGLMQAFALTALLSVRCFFKGAKALMMELILGAATLLTLSTAAFVNLPLAITVIMLRLRRGILFKILLSTSTIFLAFLFINYTSEISNVGLSSKLSGESGVDRLNAVEDAQNTLQKYPILGSVINGDLNQERSRSGSLPVYFSRHGLFGIILMLLPISIIISNPMTRGNILLLSPLVLTATASQPLFGTVPFLYLLFLYSRVKLKTVN